MMDYLLGIDLGTTNIKVLLIDEDGAIISSCSSEYPIEVPYHGFAEQNPNVWWENARKCIKKVMSESKIKSSKIASIGITGQMHGTVILNEDLKPLRPAIIWPDRRSVEECEKIRQVIGIERLSKILANPVMPGFPGPSLLWLKENESQKIDLMHKFLLPKDYIRFKLTGELVTDVSDASATLLFDVAKRKWSEEIIEALGLPLHIFPDVLESMDIAGHITPGAAVETDLEAGTPVIAGGGDAPTAALGAGVVEPGILLSNIGTGGQVLTPLDSFKFDEKLRIHTFCYVIPKSWYLQGAILSAGLSLRWFRDNFAHIEKGLYEITGENPYDTLSRQAEKVEPGCHGLIYLPYLLGERSPLMDPHARAVFFGLTYEHKRQHVIRAIMEGVTYALRDCLEVFKELGVSIRKAIACGGGARSALWRKIQADVFNLPVIKLNIEENAAFGAALLAGVAVRIYPNVKEACQRTLKVIDEIYPDQEVLLYDELYRRIYRELRNSLSTYWKCLSMIIQ
jgi:xylulokinase